LPLSTNNSGDNAGSVDAAPIATKVSSWVLYKRLWRYTKPFRAGLWVAVVAMIIAAMTEPLVPRLLQPLLDNGFSSQRTFDWWLVPLLIVGLFLVRGIATFVGNYSLAWVTGHVQTDLRVVMFAHLMKLPAAHFQTKSQSVIASKMVFDVMTIGDCIGKGLIVAIRDSAVVIGLLVYLFSTNWRLTLVVLILVPIIGVIVGLFGKRFRKTNRALLDQTGELNRVAMEASSAFKAVKIFGAYDRQNNAFKNVAGRWRTVSMKIALASAAITPVTQLFASFALAIVVSLALSQAMSGQTSVGGFVAFIIAMLMLFTPLKHLAEVNAMLQRGLASADSVFGLLDLPQEPDQGKQTVERVQGEIRFEDVSFRYEGASSNALHHVDFTIKSGEIVALVGVSGAGKTSVLNLLPRFFSPSSGRITLDGIDTESLTLGSLRRQIALVSQEIVLFNDTLAANVAFGLPDSVQPTEQQLMDALDKAALGQWVRAQPEGINVMIGEAGGKLSGGQRQRLAIARALVKDAPILLLDEATSALDVETEREVQSAIDAGMQGRTTLIIAHRLSTIAKAHRVLVFEAGRIIEQGTPQELLALGGTYARLSSVG
jgi:ATP-binding cassette, subfamily B, bacterial MsbA